MVIIKDGHGAMGPRLPFSFAPFHEIVVMSNTANSRSEARAARNRKDASGPGRRGAKKQRKGGRLRRYLLRGLLALVILGVLGVVAVAVAYLRTDIPKPQDRAIQQASTIYYADGKTPMDRIAEVNRESVTIDKIPRGVQDAFIAAEDRTFYDNDGISVSGIVRGAWATLRGGETQSGSTITQQYVKNFYLTQDQTLSRKAKEILISVKIDKELSKDQIMENYLNTIYFGRGADGIQTASKAYFGKSSSKLTVPEGALLASVIRGPSLYDPRLGPEQEAAAKDRWNYVMDGMVTQGFITQQERDAAEFPKTKAIKRSTTNTSDIGFITQEVRRELKSKLDLTDADIDRGGFKIVTTIDKDAQAGAVAAVDKQMPTGPEGKDLHVGLVAIKPGDGAIRAMYGGPKYGEKGSFYNSATQSAMQAGSTMKPFTMVAALEEGIPLSTKYSGASPFYAPEFKSQGTAVQQQGGVMNYGNSQYGVIDMRTATMKSVNTYYAQLNLAVGPGATAKAAETAGVHAYNGMEEVPLSKTPANTFGTDSVRVIDMANAYATIAAEGKRADPYLIRSVSGTGAYKLDYKAKPNVKRVFPQDVARDAIQGLSGVATAGGTAGGTAGQLGRPLAGKTGTTSDNYAAWFDGFTPGQLATAVGIYKGDGSLTEKNRLHNIPGFGEITGGSLPALIWADFMKAALDGEPVAQFPPPGNVQYRPQDGKPSPGMTAPPPPPSTSRPTSTSTTTSSSSTSTSSSTTSKTETTTSTTPTGEPTTDTPTQDPTTTTAPTTSTPTTPEAPAGKKPKAPSTP